ncbi:hypothetical protein GCM10017600_34060 [Streptosporangium carneum]|uniref:Uncharacterized protein n=1 Tax=Streptosporangium carneum TaxID=47481 RepID=A0A9W6MDK1_9ACTN|nr:hypothetical protein GCM10017600_34060 [Streptosporangium carneum]
MRQGLVPLRGSSWRSVVELSSTLTRRVLRHGGFAGRDDLIEKLEAYAVEHDETARPYRWTYEGAPFKGHDVTPVSWA